MTTFVIVHGAWTGAWSWVRVIDRLRAKGHRVHVPTLSGLGERKHLAGPGITLTTHIADIVNEMEFNDLEDVVLVAHSYGGIVATGVVEQVRERVAAIVYLDAFVPEDGQGFVDFVEGWTLPEGMVPPPPTSPGDYFSEADRAWVDAKATPQPSGTLTERLKVTGAYLDIGRKTYVVATGWNGFAEIAARFRDDPAWSVQELKCGHDMGIDMPDELVALLEKA